MRPRNTIQLFLLVVLTVSSGVQNSISATLFLSSPVGSFNGEISQFDSETGQSLGTYATTASRAQGLAFGPDGFLYIATYDSITRLSPSGSSSTFASGGGLNQPVGLVFDSSGNLFVSNAGNNSILKITPDGAMSLFAFGPELFSPRDLVIGADGFLYTGNSQTESIVKVSPAGTITTFASGGGLSNPDGLAFDDLGNLLLKGSGINY